MEAFGITIITLSKNNNNDFIKTCKSIIKQNVIITERVEWLILDKSKNEIRSQNINCVAEYFSPQKASLFIRFRFRFAFDFDCDFDWISLSIRFDFDFDSILWFGNS